MDDLPPMDRPEVETALMAANVALSGRRRREASSFASIELRTEQPSNDRWEIVVGAVVGCVAVALVVAAWVY